METNKQTSKQANKNEQKTISSLYIRLRLGLCAAIK
jgi:hypothetical protein